MRPASLHSPLALVPLCLPLAPRAEELRFDPPEGSSLEKTFRVAVEVELEDLTMVANGVDVSAGVPQEFMVSAEVAMTVVDTYVDIEEQKPLDLIRLYDSLSATWEAPDQSGSADEFDELAGKRVRFLWNGDTETYAKSYHESEGSEDALQGLGVDMDLRSVLPDGAVSEGDTWTLAPEQLVPLLFFGAELAELPLDLGKDDPSGVGALIESELVPQLRELLGELTAECTYAGRREVDGREVGAIEIDLEGEGTLDLESMILSVIDIQAEGMELDVEVDEAVIDLALDGTGTLLWDLEAGHLHAFELSPELEIHVDVALSASAGGETQDFELSAGLTSSGAWTVEVGE